MRHARSFFWLQAIVVVLCLGVSVASAQDKAKKYARFQAGKTVAYGLVKGDDVYEIDGDLYGKHTVTDKKHVLKDVKLLVPTQPVQVFAMAGNYKSHLEGGVIPEKFKIPQPFLKSIACLIADGENVIIPKGTEDVHFEAEMVIVVGKKCNNVTKEQALEYVFGVTCGNDISARDWQKNDVQWWRAKGSDTFGPCGPYIVSGVNYDNLLLQMRVNGTVLQKESTKDFIHDVATQVAFISQHTTMYPGDLIFTGTPGKTSAIKPGDKLEVELEGVGILKNGVVAEK